MKLRYLFIAMGVVLAMVAASLIILTTGPRGWTFYATEGAIAILFILIIAIHRSIVRPMNAVVSGMDLLRQQDFASRLVKVGQKDADRIVDIFNSMMDRLKSQRLIVRERNEFLDLLIHESPVGVIIFDTMGSVESANPAAARLFGMPDADSIAGVRLRDLPSSLARTASAVKGTEIIRQPDGGIYRCSAHTFMDNGWAHPFMMIESLTDEVRLAEKHAYGKLIRMIAHEVNNTMGGVNSTLSTIAEIMTSDDPDISAALDACGERCRTLTNFISRIASVAKVPEPQCISMNIDALVRGCFIFLETLCNSHRITLTAEFDRCPATINADLELMQQVMVNIVKNSVESIGSDGHIIIRTDGKELSITDDGPGISQDAAANIFSPFFTTKPQGHGLGLTLVSDILKKHGCRFSLSTDADGLTRFRIRF